jgi:hypothetical protein
LEIDSDVYPELHARLIAIQSEGGRTERMRQLATSGLVWETLRMQGTGPVVPAHGPLAHMPPHTPVAHMQAHTAAAQMQAHAPLAHAQGRESRAQASASVTHAPGFGEPSTSASQPAPVAPSRSSTAGPRRPPSPPADPHFVDLAIDAVPPLPMESLAPRTVPAELDAGFALPANHRLPVLQDVVEPHTVSASAGRPDGETREPAPPAFNDTQPLPAWAEPSQPAGPRSRLMRMKERGLFKNT